MQAPQVRAPMLGTSIPSRRNAAVVKAWTASGGKKTKQGRVNLSQVAYFDCKTSFIYSNLVLAKIYVTVLVVEGLW